MLDVSVVNDALALAEGEIEKFGLPTRLHFDLSMAKGQEIARALKADVEIVRVGVSLMDVKLGQAFSEGKLAQHVAMSVEAAKAFLARHSVSGEACDKIVNCVAAHHAKTPFSCLEAEIVANADCYRFIHPTGVLHYIGTLTRRNLPFPEIIAGARAKVEEKRAILSLPMCRAELEPIAVQFLTLFTEAVRGGASTVAG